MAVAWLSGLEESIRGASSRDHKSGLTQATALSLTAFDEELAAAFAVPHQVAVDQKARRVRQGPLAAIAASIAGSAAPGAGSPGSTAAGSVAGFSGAAGAGGPVAPPSNMPVTGSGTGQLHTHSGRSIASAGMPGPGASADQQAMWARRNSLMQQQQYQRTGGGIPDPRSMPPAGAPVGAGGGGDASAIAMMRRMRGMRQGAGGSSGVSSPGKSSHLGSRSAANGSGGAGGAAGSGHHQHQLDMIIGSGGGLPSDMNSLYPGGRMSLTAPVVPLAEDPLANSLFTDVLPHDSAWPTLPPRAATGIAASSAAAAQSAPAGSSTQSPSASQEPSPPSAASLQRRGTPAIAAAAGSGPSASASITRVATASGSAATVAPLAASVSAASPPRAGASTTSREIVPNPAHYPHNDDPYPVPPPSRAGGGADGAGASGASSTAAAAAASSLPEHPDAMMYHRYVAFGQAATALVAPATSRLHVFTAPDQVALFAATVHGAACATTSMQQVAPAGGSATTGTASSSGSGRHDGSGTEPGRHHDGPATTGSGSMDDMAACAEWSAAWGLTTTLATGPCAGIGRSTLASSLLRPMVRPAQSPAVGWASGASASSASSSTSGKATTGCQWPGLDEETTIPEDPLYWQALGADALTAPVEPVTLLAMMPALPAGLVCRSLAVPA